MEIDSDRVKAFHQLAVSKSFSSAARELGITQSALSQKIAKLEDELESTLVIRDQKALKLTESGLELLRYYKVKAALDEEYLNYLRADVKNQLSGQVNLATFSSVAHSIILPTLAPFFKLHPLLRFSLQSKEVRELEGVLLRGEVDFIVSNQEVKRENIESRILGYEEIVHIVPKFEKACPEIFLDHDPQDETTFDFFKSYKLAGTPKRSFLDDIHGIVTGVELGLGQAVVSKHLVAKNPRVKIIKYPKGIKVPVVLSFFKRGYYSKLHLKLIETLEQNVKHLLGGE